MTETQEIIQYLRDKAKTLGTVAVRKACREYLRDAEKVEREPRPRIPPDWVRAAWMRQGGRCNICKGPLALDEAEGDHVESWSRGGEHKASNIAAVHGTRSQKSCNQEKGGRGLFGESKRTGHTLKEILPEDR